MHVYINTNFSIHKYILPNNYTYNYDNFVFSFLKILLYFLYNNLIKSDYTVNIINFIQNNYINITVKQLIYDIFYDLNNENNKIVKESKLTNTNYEFVLVN